MYFHTWYLFFLLSTSIWFCGILAPFCKSVEICPCTARPETRVVPQNAALFLLVKWLQMHSILYKDLGVQEIRGGFTVCSFIEGTYNWGDKHLLYFQWGDLNIWGGPEIFGGDLEPLCQLWFFSHVAHARYYHW